MHGTHYCEQHLTNKILYPLQHGFRKRLSRDSQLLSLFHDLASGLAETDLIVMDFSKSFDKVPHRRLLYKLEWYRIRCGTLDWITCFLTDRTQKVILDDAESLPGPVLSLVSQGSVLGPILLLIYINNLPDGVTHSRPTVRLFSDILYIRSANMLKELLLTIILQPVPLLIVSFAI